MAAKDGYVGLTTDLSQGEGITPIAKIILDARLFGLIDEKQECTGWQAGGIQDLYDKVANAWEPYGSLPSRLPDDLREKHARLYEKAIAVASENGWDPDLELRDER